MYNQFGFFDESNSVVLFRFSMYNSPDSFAARVWTYSDPALTPPAEHMSDVNQGFKRSEEEWANFTAAAESRAAKLTFKELEAYIRSGQGNELLVPASESFVPWSDLGGMAMQMSGMQTGVKLRWDANDEMGGDEEDYEQIVEHQLNTIHEISNKKQVIKRQLAYRSTSDPTMTPLLKRASLNDIQTARGIVQDAITKSSKLNEVRLANPMRNTYGLKPKTGVGSSSVQGGNSTASLPPPLLQITDEIAAAAALVAEADAVNATGYGNVTRRAVAASGSYWMGSLDRMGTVPWGNNAIYKVFRSMLDYGAVGDGVTVCGAKEAASESKRITG